MRSQGATESKDPAFEAITRDQLIDFFAWLRDEYLSEPDGAAPRGQIKLSPKTILNIHTDLSGLWTWGVEEGFVPANIVRTIDPPDPKAPVVETLTKEEIDALLGACDRSKTWKNRQITANERPTADRDRAIILLLLDTGLRASELCGIKFGDINLTTNSIKVLGKGQKERLVYFGKRTSKALWKLLTPRLKDSKPEDLVFTVGSGGRSATNDARRAAPAAGPHRGAGRGGERLPPSVQAHVRHHLPAQPGRPVHLAGPARPLGHGDGEALRPYRADRLRQGAPEGVAGG